MDKEKLLYNIEDGLLNYYLNKDYTLKGKVLFEPTEEYEGQTRKYSKLAKQILFKTKTKINEIRISKVISIAEASGRLKVLQEKNKDNVFPIFKKHIEKFGLAVNYRNFENMTIDEMEKILSQIDFTALFDEINDEIENE